MGTYVRTLTVLVRVNTGPPTWWKPRVGAEFMQGKMRGFHLNVGWLNTAVQIGIGTRRHPEEEQTEPPFHGSPSVMQHDSKNS